MGNEQTKTNGVTNSVISGVRNDQHTTITHNETYRGVSRSPSVKRPSSFRSSSGLSRCFVPACLVKNVPLGTWNRFSTGLFVGTVQRGTRHAPSRCMGDAMSSISRRTSSWE